MIGHIAEAYRKGRMDARAGVKQRRDRHHDTDQVRRFYLLGWKDEKKRMDAIRECPQLEMALETEKRPPQIHQDRRSHERTSPHALDLMDLGGLD